MNKKTALTKIMLVDDDDDTLTIAKYCLEQLQDVEIKYLHSGEEAVKEALSFNPDMILLDVMMPKMDGIATLKALRLLPSTAHVPVVFFTAKTQQEELSNYRQMGIVDVITKPFDPMTFATRILGIWDRYQSQQK